MAPARTPQWWRHAVIYQVYLRSFADGDADGVGDVAGLRSRLPYLRDLGVDAIWISPWYPSPLRDGGYDVVDYRDIDPLFGTLDDARALVAEAHACGVRVLLDLVANHSSDQHPWFQAALRAAPGSPERRRYHFRDGRGPDCSLPPNDWISAFGGPAWTRVTDAAGRHEQWYLHLFSPHQPDFNWADAGVRDEFESILRFWFDLGVDGMRVDAASALAKHPGLPDAGLSPDAPFDPRAWTGSPLWDVDDVHQIFTAWRALADAYTDQRVLLGEVIVNGAHRLARYVRPGELNTAFVLDLVKTGWNAAALRDLISSALNALGEVHAPATWLLSSHDETRQVTRYGRPDATERLLSTEGRPATSDLVLGTRRARAAILLLLALPGNACLYQGEELGLWNVDDLPVDVLQDPIVARTGDPSQGRDGCRVPLPWHGDKPPFGFTADGSVPWLPQPPQWSDHTAERQAGVAGSTLELYRAAIALRHNAGDEFAWGDPGNGVLAFSRGNDFHCVVNLSELAVQLPEPVLLSSEALDGNVLPPDAAAWLTRPGMPASRRTR